MQYTDVSPAVFLARPNRFVAEVEQNGETIKCHVKNTGRLKELLVPGADVYIQKAKNPNRKTGYDLFAVYKGDTLVNIDSQAPNHAFGSWLAENDLFGADAVIHPESSYGNSRFDFYVESGERVIIVMGAVCVIKPRVSGTLTKYISCIA